MRAGKLKDSITIERATMTVDDLGTPQTAWAELARVRAERVKLTVDELKAAYGAATEALVTFRIRWLPDLSLADRVVVGSMAFDIKHIEVIGNKAGLTLICKARP